MQNIFLRFFLLCLLAHAAACATIADNEAVPENALSLNKCLNKDLTDRLTSNLEAMLSLSEDIRHISEGHLFYGSDEQLNIIQKSRLYILISIRNAQHQKELLSIVEYVRSDRSEDYAALLVKGLERAVFDSAYHLNSLNTYYAFIENHTAREKIDDSVKFIRDNMDLYKQIITDLNNYFAIKIE